MIKIKTICELLLENNSYVDDKDLIDSYKLRLLGEFFRSAYNKNPVTIEFDLSAPTGDDLVECVERFKIDGMYWFKGNTVARESLEKIISETKCVLTLKISDRVNGDFYVT